MFLERALASVESIHGHICNQKNGEDSPFSEAAFSIGDSTHADITRWNDPNSRQLYVMLLGLRSYTL